MFKVFKKLFRSWNNKFLNDRKENYVCSKGWMEHAELTEATPYMVKVLPADEYEVALMWRNDGQTQKKTAELMGIPQNRVKYLWRQAIINGDCSRRR